MAELVNSISFQDNYLIWLLAEADSDQSIHIKRVVEAPLPFVISYENLTKPAAALEIANRLKSLASRNGMTTENVRFLLPARFGLVKKVLLDQYVPEAVHEQIIHSELSETLVSPLDDYLIYTPPYSRENNFLEERLVVAFRKKLFALFRDVAANAEMNLSQINLNTFALDALFRRLYPNMLGETMLANFTEHGVEVTLSAQSNFLNYFFKPYSKSLQKIDELDDQQLTDFFVAMVDDIQRPGSVDFPLYSISQIYLFGTHLREKLVDALQSENLPTARILNPMEVNDWQIILNEKNLEDELHRFIEPLANAIM